MAYTLLAGSLSRWHIATMSSYVQSLVGYFTPRRVEELLVVDPGLAPELEWHGPQLVLPGPRLQIGLVIHRGIPLVPPPVAVQVRHDPLDAERLDLVRRHRDQIEVGAARRVLGGALLVVHAWRRVDLDVHGHV